MPWPPFNRFNKIKPKLRGERARLVLHCVLGDAWVREEAGFRYHGRASLCTTSPIPLQVHAPCRFARLCPMSLSTSPFLFRHQTESATGESIGEERRREESKAQPLAPLHTHTWTLGEETWRQRQELAHVPRESQRKAPLSLSLTYKNTRARACVKRGAVCVCSDRERACV